MDRPTPRWTGGHVLTASRADHGQVTARGLGGTVVEGPPKPKAGARTIALDADTVRALRGRRKVQAVEQLAMGGGWPDIGLVFANADWTGLWPQRITAEFRRTAERPGLPLIGVHGLRHTSATWLIASGVSPRVVQQRLGHADVSVTLGLYTHVLPGHDVAAAEALARAIGSAPRPNSDHAAQRGPHSPC